MHFLKNQWRPYPALTESLVDCTQLVTSQRSAWVGGRLVATHDPSGFRLASGGAEIVVDLRQAQWHALCLQQSAEFHTSCLHVGDTLALQVEWLQERWQARTVALLTVPTTFYSSDVAIERGLQWTGFLQTVRDFFSERGFAETPTPTLVPCPGTEPYLDTFTTEWIYGKQRQNFYLPTSPELHLKKLLVLGWTRVFEMRSCFRNGELGPHHLPEFTMLEWYRAYSHLDAILEDLWALLQKLHSAIPARAQCTFSVADLFLRHCDFQLRPETTAYELQTLCEKWGIAVSREDSFDDLFFRLFLEKIEPHLGHDSPVVVRYYPPSLAAFSRLTPEGWGDRFELYWKGLEIANAFHELNDPTENQSRQQADLERQKQLGKKPVDLDIEFFKALEFGLPPAGGIALGLERLFMALHNISDIRHIFPFREDLIY